MFAGGKGRKLQVEQTEREREHPILCWIREPDKNDEVNSYCYCYIVIASNPD